MVICVECKKKSEENEPNKIKFCLMKYYRVCDSCEKLYTYRTCCNCNQPLCSICESNGQHECKDLMIHEGEEE